MFLRQRPSVVWNAQDSVRINYKFKSVNRRLKHNKAFQSAQLRYGAG